MRQLALPSALLLLPAFLLMLVACAQQAPVGDFNATALCGPQRNCTQGFVCEYSNISLGAEGECVPLNASRASDAITGARIISDDQRIYACERDEDCVRQASCCDCGEGTWVNRQYYDNSSCPPGTPVCRCALQSRYPVCENGRCTSRSAR